METQKENKLAVIVNESGLDKTKAQVLLENFSNYFDIASDWESKAKMLIITDISQVAEMKMADEGRKFLKAKRIDIEKTRKVLKENALREGQTIDSIARILKNLITPIEIDLEQKAKYREIKEAEAKEAKKQERIKMVEPFGELHDFYMIGEMSDEGFKNYYEGMKLNYEKRIAEEKAAEEKRLAEIEAEKKRQEAIKAENERLRKEAEEKEKQLKAEREKAEAERKKKEIEYQKKLDSERKEREKAEAELRAKQEAERKAKTEAEVERKKQIDAEKKAARAPDKVKIIALSEVIERIELPEVKSQEAKEIIGSTKILLQKVVNYLIEKSNNF